MKKIQHKLVLSYALIALFQSPLSQFLRLQAKFQNWKRMFPKLPTDNFPKRKFL